MDWLLADVEKREGRRLRALVPNLCEHIGRAVNPASLAAFLPMRSRWNQDDGFNDDASHCFGLLQSPPPIANNRTQSSLKGVKRDWQKSAWFKKVGVFIGADEPANSTGYRYPVRPPPARWPPLPRGALGARANVDVIAAGKRAAARYARIGGSGGGGGAVLAATGAFGGVRARPWAEFPSSQGQAGGGTGAELGGADGSSVADRQKKAAGPPGGGGGSGFLRGWGTPGRWRRRGRRRRRRGLLDSSAAGAEEG